MTPAQPERRWRAKAFEGEIVPFGATVFKEGHDLLRVEVELRDPDGAVTRRRLAAGASGTDRWQAHVPITAPGDWRFRILAARDDWATWLHAADIKIAAEQDQELVLQMGAELLAGRATRVFKDARTTLLDAGRPPQDRLRAAHDARLAAAIEQAPITSLETWSEEHELHVERARAAVGSWYEFFPRSEGATRRKDGSWKSGTFRTAEKRLPGVAAMGFDVLYLPPIHPIGRAFRKGPNNSTTAAPGDPGSPWAIGAAEGGHDAVHPDLGTLEDFRRFVRAARKQGIEVALDLALQASPDHPWVREHPEWFTSRPDGSIAYAENPPKKYQDIYPVNFDDDPEGIRAEVLRIVRHWIAQGVKIFRVDNPHTKPLDFWEWLLAVVAEEHPDVVFLAEAFTRPAMLHSLAGAGFHQSYTYFTWRNTKEELEEFLSGLAKDSADYLRPNLFVNTPDILTEYLQFGGRPAYKVRAAIAATAAPTWGVYAGYELFEDIARPGSEENIDNEKYEYKQRDWAAAEAAGSSLAPYLTMLNRARAEHPALRQLRNLELHWSEDDAILVYSKTLDAAHAPGGRPDGVIVVANVDPHSVRETTVHLDLATLGLEPGAEFTVRDVVTGARWTWRESNYVRLDAFSEPVHILEIEYPRGR
ncbi:alpha-1,4-glucan--maltose-1-phosphate maltosyltransferase [Homoserinibacter sp. YIM 151385]|uniref:alpha-1,4-glucan--maltose-1-phosphate maltosyltransferase n=1 Tax=Homoserinibacter sp. YIM 151385 TaxID=2985506 RepID=UPI0022F11C11|nr:alpha-1,4-glucan--maltose-1-phosphate maltosyltransferase [Homoserinibacter sp. YIM 151385]WBU39365.1 DUF3416 domain-containing protein [Homoserinibacter sp. YIM 151385]